MYPDRVCLIMTCFWRNMCTSLKSTMVHLRVQDTVECVIDNLRKRQFPLKVIYFTYTYVTYLHKLPVTIPIVCVCLSLICDVWFVVRDQCRNRLGAGVQGGQSVPQRLLTGKFMLTYREKKSRKKRKRGENWDEKNTVIVKGKVENWKWK